MTIENLPDIVYHGSISIHKESLLTGININKGYPSVDFGQGFYTTSNYEQALNLAEGRARAYSKIHNVTSVYPIIISYNVDKSVLNHHKGLIFDFPDSKWKEFVFNNRVGDGFQVSNYHNLNKKYDYVYGCVADSFITDMTKQIKSGKIDFGQFTDNLKPLKMEHFDQLSFHSNEIVKCLEFKDIELIESEVLFI